MEFETIHCKNRNDERLWTAYEERLLAALHGTVFHLTSQHAFNLIKASGAIEHNKEKRFKLNTNSEMSFGRLMGWVCLFDLRNPTPERITDTLDRYNFLLPPGDLGRETSNGLAYFILDSTYYDRLIPYEKFNEHFRNTGQFPMAVPKVETWIANRLPLTWIKKFILASIDVILTDEQIRLAQVNEWVHRNRNWGPD